MTKKLSLQEAIDLYKSVGERNANYLFNWLYKVYSNAFFPTVADDFKETLTIDKTKLTILDVLIDDLADNYKLRKKRLLEKAVKIPLNEYSARIYDGNYLRAIQKIWNDVHRSVRRYPRFREFKEIFFFDLAQVMNSMKYNYLVNEGMVGDDLEDGIYMPHGVMVILHTDMDFMCSPNLDIEQMKLIRPALYYAQNIAHIGNLLNTYPREIKEKDFSSPIISLGIRRGIIKKSDILKPIDDNVKAKLEVLEDHFKKRAEDNFKEIEQIANDSINEQELNEYSKCLRKVYDGFLQRKKYWEDK